MELARATNRSVRLRNRSALLTKLFLDGPLTRQDLVRSTGLSQPAVSNVVADMIDEGLVVEAGAAESDGGRPSMLLRIAHRFAFLIGVDVGETRVRVELFDFAMTLLASVEYPLDPARTEPDLVAGHVLAGIEAVTGQAGVAPGDVLGVGIGVSGVVEQGTEAVVHAQALGWDRVPLERLIGAGTDLPLHIDNGAKTLGQAEMWFGAGRGARHAVFALVGSGVGASVVTNGATYRGASSSAGEWGHTTLVYGGRVCRCGARGCLEAYVGAEAIIDRYREARRGRPVPGEDEESQIAALVAAAETSATARRVLEDTAGYLGAGVANLINLFNPERVVLGGWAAMALGDLLPAVREAAGRQALRQPYEQASIELCRLGVDAVALGAATLPIARFLTEGGVRR
ncbi:MULTISPECIES: ROK family transcriptional regulator [Micromonospora]|uniref:Sugar kinase of the NBD/HSP70 family, may contain an N-terminal HTH domain n=1 Tax=Micromonospora saelicesensis TaxID=285676 RepID=A0A1C4W223_9ACTN|nr:MULTISPECIES: ROK family transcriptional regulator [Micromonospora]RAO59027.1 N-acetylglucosamine repressor [Micromonospora noduli]SCE90284.1 Sugar kinase of the NBD/HSP70 family, may contain an N-terminal HTH domain [Micromonospora saelicesensis]